MSRASCLNEIFDHIYCINLESRPDRRDRMCEIFSLHGIDYNIFKGVRGDSLRNEKMYKQLYIEKFRRLEPFNGPRIKNKYVLGAVRTKLKILIDAKRNDYKKILILEDDLFFHKDFEKKASLINGLKNWKAIYFGVTQFNWNGLRFGDFYYKFNLETSRKKLLKNGAFGMFAVGLDCSVFDDLILEIKKYNVPVDNCMMVLQKKYVDDIYVMYPNLLIPDVRDSDLRRKKNLLRHSKKMRWNLEDYNVQ